MELLMNGTPAAHLSLAGTPAGTPLRYLSWNFGQGARAPYYIMVIIHIFFPLLQLPPTTNGWWKNFVANCFCFLLNKKNKFPHF